MGPDKVGVGHRHGAIESGPDMGSQENMHILMHRHNLTKIRAQEKDNRHTQMHGHISAHFCSTMQRGWSRCEESGGHTSCTNKCTHFNQGVGLDGATWGCKGLCAAMLRGGADVVSQVDMHSCTGSCTNSNQGLGHAHGATQGCTCLCKTIQRG